MIKCQIKEFDSQFNKLSECINFACNRISELNDSCGRFYWICNYCLDNYIKNIENYESKTKCPNCNIWIVKFKVVKNA